jgi:hypothetical protein
MKLYVIAENYNRFREWCWERHVPHQQAYYVGSAEALSGLTLKHVQIALVPGWANRSDAAELSDAVARVTGSQMADLA